MTCNVRVCAVILWHVTNEATFFAIEDVAKIVLVTGLLVGLFTCLYINVQLLFHCVVERWHQNALRTSLLHNPTLPLQSQRLCLLREQLFFRLLISIFFFRVYIAPDYVCSWQPLNCVFAFSYGWRLFLTLHVWMRFFWERRREKNKFSKWPAYMWTRPNKHALIFIFM